MDITYIILVLNLNFQVVRKKHVLNLLAKFFLSLSILLGLIFLFFDTSLLLRFIRALLNLRSFSILRNSCTFLCIRLCHFSLFLICIYFYISFLLRIILCGYFLFCSYFQIDSYFILIFIFFILIITFFAICNLRNHLILFTFGWNSTSFSLLIF